MTPLVVKIPHTPDPRLSPNARGNPLKRGDDGESKVSLTRTLRQSARLSTQSLLNRSPWPRPAGDMRLHLLIAWPSSRANKELPDDDNAIASCKALRDGIADALAVNDKRMRSGGVDQIIDPDGQGYVIATITPMETPPCTAGPA